MQENGDPFTSRLATIIGAMVGDQSYRSSVQIAKPSSPI